MDDDINLAAPDQDEHLIEPIIDEPTADDIFRAAARGFGARTLSKMFNISVLRVREVIRRERLKEEDPLKADPAESVRTHLFQLDAIVEELAAIASKEKGSVRLQATAIRFRVMRERAQIQQAIVGLPHGVAPLRGELELRQTIEQVLDALDEEGTLTESLLESLNAAATGLPLGSDDLLLGEGE